MILSLIIGSFIGAAGGFFGASLLITAKREDENIDAVIHKKL